MRGNCFEAVRVEGTEEVLMEGIGAVLLEGMEAEARASDVLAAALLEA